MSWEELKLNLSDEIKKLLEERHIAEDEVKMTIHHAETEGDKLYQPGASRYLARLKIGKATFYVEYALEGDRYVVRTAYAHKAEITG